MVAKRERSQTDIKSHEGGSNFKVEERLGCLS